MSKYVKFTFNNGELNQTLANLFRDMLEKGVVDAVLAPADQGNERVMQTLISDAGELDSIDPFAPVVPVNSAKLVSSLTAQPSGRPVAAVMRSCEVRALIELVKLKQADLDDIVLIGMDCLGRYENTDYVKLRTENKSTEDFLEAAGDGKTEVDGMDISSACTACEYPVAPNVDLRLCVIGAEAGTFYVEGVSNRGQAVLEKLELVGGEEPAEREEKVKNLITARSESRDQLLSAFRNDTDDFQKLQEHLAGCINCYNCRVACPVCYCKECVFVTDTFRHAGDQYINWADQQGALKMPSDTVFFHLTRLAHISTLCVGCGQCSSACPNGIELMPLFRSVSETSQARFNYLAGRSLEEAQPLATFYDEELVEVTGQVK